MTAWPNIMVDSTMKRRPKRAKQSVPVSVVKQSRLIGVAAIEGRYLAWRFSRNDQDGTFSWSQITENDRRAVWKRLGEFEKMTLAEIRDTGSHHRVPVSRRNDGELQLDDLDEIWSFRVTGERRFWCVKRENIYELLWWDPEHRVYPVSKKGNCRSVRDYVLIKVVLSAAGKKPSQSGV